MFYFTYILGDFLLLKIVREEGKKMLRQPIGVEFENAMIEKFGSISIKIWGNSAYNDSEESQDKLKGTDVFILGVPVDVTLNIQNKSHTTFCSKNYIVDLGFANVEFGVRFGNGHVKFENPVLVIGFNTLLGSVLKFPNMLGQEDIKKIIESGMDFYYKTLDAVESALCVV